MYPTVLWATGTLEVGKPQTITIPVDSLTKRITFTFSVDTKGNQIKLTQPSGGVITEGIGGTEDTELNCGRIVTVSTPQAGEWRGGNHRGRPVFGWKLRRRVIFFFVRVEFVKVGGRPGHEGFFRIQGQPLAGNSCDSSGVAIGNPRP